MTRKLRTAILDAMNMSENDIAKFLDDGGPASCKSLRDWFAGNAICGLMADPQCFPNEELAKIAYKVADLMLAERAKEGAK